MSSDSKIGQSSTDWRSFGIELAMAARKETLGSQAQSSVENKGQDDDFDPVTGADRAAERAMRELIERRYPRHGICGEELADKTATSRYTWSLDPIDGTRSYICALPTWTTLIALLEDAEPIFGLIDAPRLDETYIATDRETALFAEGKHSPLQTSGCKRIREARFSTTDPFRLGLCATKVQEVVRTVQVTCYGHDAYAYARLAAGSIDLVIERGLKPHDYNALIPVIRGAGGHIGDWNGGRTFAPGAVIAASSRELYNEAVALLADT